MEKRYYALYNSYNIRAIANKLTKKYVGLREPHVYWIAKELNIYPDGIVHKKTKSVDMTKTGRINKNNTEYVSGGRLTDKGIEAIEAYLLQEGYKTDEKYSDEQIPQPQPQSQPQPQITNIWEKADLIAMMKKDYDTAVAERDAAKDEANHYCQLADKYEKEIEELKDKLLISEKENNDLKSEKKELGKMQMKTVDFSQEIESLQNRIGKYSHEINTCLSELNTLRKDISAIQTRANKLIDDKKKLDGVLSDLVGCSKRLMNMR